MEQSAKPFERQWRGDDLSTTDYLLALNQRAESLLAGIALEKQARSRSPMLLQSGRLATATMPQHCRRIENRMTNMNKTLIAMLVAGLATAAASHAQTPSAPEHAREDRTRSRAW